MQCEMEQGVSSPPLSSEYLHKLRSIQKNQIISDCKSSQLVGGFNPFEKY